MVRGKQTRELPTKDPLVFSRKFNVWLTNQNELELALVKKDIGSLSDAMALRYALGETAFRIAVGHFESERLAKAPHDDWMKFYQEALKLEEGLHKDPTVART